MLFIAAAAATAALPGSSLPSMGAETVGKPVVRSERGLALKVIGQRLDGKLQDGLRVFSLGSRSPVSLSRPLALMYDDANRMAGWIAILQQSVYHRMGDTIDTVSLVEVTKAEATSRPLAFAVGQRWFAVDYVELHYSGRADMSKQGPVRELVEQTACRFMSQVAAAAAIPGSCAENPAGAVVLARR
jgi:hypothetical protein